MDNLLFQLKKELEYSIDGDFEKTATIELGPPSYKCFDQATQLSQFVMAAVLASTRFERLAKVGKTEKDPKDPNEPIDADAVKFILMSTEDKFEDIHACFRKLACKVGTVSENIPLINGHFSKMSYEDNIRILCEYVANFIMPSLF